METRKSIKFGTGLAAGLLMVSLASTPAQAHSSHDVVGPVAAFIALNWAFNHRHHHHRYHYHHRYHDHHGHYHKRHRKYHRKHSHSHGGYYKKKHRVKHKHKHW